LEEELRQNYTWQDSFYSYEGDDFKKALALGAGAFSFTARGLKYLTFS